MIVDLELSRRLAELSRAQPKNCYRNAVVALGSLVDKAGCCYVEGVAVLAVQMFDANKVVLVPMEHGWLELPGERIGDPTWSDGAGLAYFAALRWTHDELLVALDKRRRLPLFQQQRFDREASPAMQAAWARAHALVATGSEQEMVEGTECRS